MEFWIFFIFFIILVTYAYGSWRAAPWVPMWNKDVKRFLRLAQIKPGDKVYDLGSGDGRLVYAAALAGANAQGFEISLLPYLISKLRMLFYKGSGTYKISYQDFWKADLRDADAVYFFLMPKIMDKMKIKLERELKPGTKVISYVFSIPGWPITETNRLPGNNTIYCYQIKG